MSKFYRLKVLQVKRETPDAVSVSLEIPDNLKSEFDFLSGQYLTFRFMIDGEEVRRSYSICSSKYHQEPITVAIKKVFKGKASTWINEQLKAGDFVEAMPPLGKFHTPLSSSNQKNYYLFAGGSGITPMMSILKSVMHVEPQSKVTLFYGNNDAVSIIFRADLDRLVAEYQGRIKLVHILNQASDEIKGYQGLMTQENALQMLKEQTSLHFADAEFFVCGPGVMMDNVKHALQQLGVPDSKIHIEYFTAKTNAEDMHAENVSSGEAQPEITSGKAKVIIRYDGNVHEFEMDVKETVLEAALDAGYDPPYSCMVAACCTCRAKLLNGKVHMDDRESLTDGEIKDGYVLTCQSHPRTALVELDYDK